LQALQLSIEAHTGTPPAADCRFQSRIWYNITQQTVYSTWSIWYLV